MEYDNDENTWRRPSTPKVQRTKCQQIPKRSTSLAVVVLGLAVLSCLLGYCVLSETLPYESKTLRLVIIFFRHGARNPTHSYKSDPFKNYQWPDGLGSLTNIGKLQLYELGRKYRTYYANFINDEYYEKDVYIRSSDKSRCMMSAYTFLAGLFPPTERQMWHPEIPWQPIPVHSLPRDLDNIVAGTKECKVWTAMYKELLAEKNADPKFSELFDSVSKYTNQSMRSVLDVDFLYSTLLTEQEAGLKLPEWTKNVFPNKMRMPFMLSLALLSYNETLQRFKVGPLLNEIKKSLEESVSHTSQEHSMCLYSGHDVNVVGLWRALGFSELLEPEYGASIVLELHEEVEQSSFFVKMQVSSDSLVCHLCWTAAWNEIRGTTSQQQSAHTVGHTHVCIGCGRSLLRIRFHSLTMGIPREDRIRNMIAREFAPREAFYRNNTKVEVPIEMKLPFCDDPCPYETFIEYINSLIPNDWEGECQNVVH